MRGPVDPVMASNNIGRYLKTLKKAALPLNRELNVYRTRKSELSYEPFLEIKKYERRKALAQVKSSSH